MPMIKAQIWQRMAEVQGIPELRGEPDLYKLRAKYRRLYRQVGHQKAKAFYSIVAGGAWSQQRKLDAGMAEEDQCPRCKEGPEDLHHIYWECKANREIPQLHSEAQQKLALPLQMEVV